MSFEPTLDDWKRSAEAWQESYEREFKRRTSAERRLAALRREVRSVATHTGVSDDMAVRLDAAADRSAEVRKKGGAR